MRLYNVWYKFSTLGMGENHENRDCRKDRNKIHILIDFMSVNAHCKLRKDSAPYKILMDKSTGFISPAITGNTLSLGDHLTFFFYLRFIFSQRTYHHFFINWSSVWSITKLLNFVLISLINFSSSNPKLMYPLYNVQ